MEEHVDENNIGDSKALRKDLLPLSTSSPVNPGRLLERLTNIEDPYFFLLIMHWSPIYHCQPVNLSIRESKSLWVSRVETLGKHLQLLSTSSPVNPGRQVDRDEELYFRDLPFHNALLFSIYL